MSNFVACPVELVEAARLHRPAVAVVLGSGFGSLVTRVKPLCAVPFSACPPMAPTTVPGHEGKVVFGLWNRVGVLLFCGRNHLYEGHSHATIVAPVRLADHLGIRTVVLTSAAGGIRDDLTPGKLLIAERLLDWTRPGPRIGDPVPLAHSESLRRRLSESAARLGWTGISGTYAGVLGPCYETPAEIRALRAVGADAVGMSTVHEAAEAATRGLTCVAVSCITNRAAGLSGQRLSHAEVLAESQRQQQRLGDLLEDLLPRLCS
jgi:purine-nucleoside phosphorylase